MIAVTFDFDANPDFVAEYDCGPPLFIPGCAASHAMAAAVLTDRIDRRATCWSSALAAESRLPRSTGSVRNGAIRASIRRRL
jgi:hypothetical protein